MYFSKSFIAAATVFLGLAVQAHAHAGVQPALGVNGAFARSNVQRPSTAKPCGNVDVAKNIDKSTAIPVNADGTFTATVTNFNGGTDGSRQVSAKVDTSGTGKFAAATVTRNGDKSPKNVGSQQIAVQLPKGIQCSGGAAKNRCVVSFTTAGGFGNCVVVQTANAPTAAKTPAQGKKARDIDAVGTRAARALRAAEREEEEAFEDVEDVEVGEDEDDEEDEE
ncbi:hypothetical protein C8Q77DRAFT_1219389 [Trametes polyzona]|nr:hypothetical protein C8Q77DRAFT_1219389 [Trametes polyzona]